ncbi:palmitoyl-protein thioesterase 1 [Culex quinquefasciatus]|uniref:Palmitoyl-protein thioesterase 1 n=1 Tax=Culex quinquefasciatus TaxID=7176 RepID=B0W1X8_CULQU|nr:palmitoyl-protein thioesterase 1 [Culex quinquefasciatus]|eukprot:XP_001842712.1 palmitoyl-protein thioesterase 1 [Culex quinquefasciatus]
MKTFGAIGALIVLLAVQASGDNVTSPGLPIVMWHGMDDTCCFPFSLGGFKKFLEAELGVYVKSLEIGNSIVTDYKSGYLIHPNRQVEDVCNQLNGDPQLANGYNAIGFSQGGQFLRAIAQRCPTPRMNNLITLGGQHQGVFGLPDCPSISSKTCEYFRQLLNYAAYASWVQNYLVQATYWHDPLNEQAYKESSTFLADINNERTVNETYIENLQQLNKFVMVKFTKDKIVQPIESQWFGYYKPGQDRETQKLEESELFLKNRLGLQEMQQRNKLVFLECPGNHLQFTKDWFKQNIYPFL